MISHRRYLNRRIPVYISISVTVAGRKQPSQSLFFFGTIRFAARRAVNGLHRSTDKLTENYNYRHKYHLRYTPKLLSKETTVSCNVLCRQTYLEVLFTFLFTFSSRHYGSC